jgi:signal transduction histidine kinase
LLALWLAAFLLPQCLAAAQVKQTRRVLILDDLGVLSSPGFAEIDQAVFAGLQKSPYQIELYYESLELTLFPDEISQRRFREHFIQKYFDRRPDVIIAAGSASLSFIAQSDQAFLRATPIIFCAILGNLPDQLKPDMHFTGVLGKLHPEETLKAALELLPGTRHVVVVSGMGKFDAGFEAIAKQAFQNYESKLEFTYLSNLSMPSLLERLRHLPSNTIVYHTAISQDAAGERFIDSAQSVPLVARAANAPVFVMDDVDLRGGTVGGDLVNWADDGRIAAEMAVRVLNGERPEDIPIVTSIDAFMFDWRALQRWGLKESALPRGSTVLFREPSVWARTKWLWITTLLVILALSLLAAYLNHSRGQLKVARDAQLHLSALLIDAQDKERSRLAAELHDDFSQRVALLVLGLQDARGKLPLLKDGVEENLKELEESVLQLGDDLHSVSHRLHSYTLARLGLVSGVDRLCREFAAHQGIEINFSSEGVPPDVDPDVSLCLFRIVQEALQNLKKHSGAARAQVNLQRVGEKLFLTVSDEGRGFDTAQIKDRGGLGIASMQGRVRLLRGEFEIHSKLGKGTRVELWVPLQPKTVHEEG